MEQFLRQLFESDGVVGALLVGRDGLIVASLMDDARADGHAAHAAAAFEALARYTRQMTLGMPRQALVETATSAILLVEAGDLIIVVETNNKANLGRLRLDAARVARDLSARTRG